MKTVEAALNQEKALVGAFSVITNLRMELFEALVSSELIQEHLSWNVTLQSCHVQGIHRHGSLSPRSPRPGAGAEVPHHLEKSSGGDFHEGGKMRI